MKQIELMTYELRCQVDLIRKEHPGCGVEKMYYQLKPDWIGRDRFIKLFIGLGYGITAHKKFHKTTLPVHINYPNLIEGLLVYGINTVWQSDITYYSIGKNLYYLVFIEDVFSRRILGYQASNHLRTQANIHALQKAFSLRNCDLKGTIHHSDRGSQYSDHGYLNMLSQKNMLISMGLRGQDNAYVERINGIIKNEYLKYWSIETLAELQDKLKKAVKHYNTKRPHKSLPNRMPPVEFELGISNNPQNANFNEWIYSDKLKVNQKSYKFEMTDLTGKKLVCPLIDY